MVPAVVPELQFVGLAAQSNPGQLMTEADAEDRLASQQAADVVDRVSAGLGITGSVRKEHTVGFQSEDVFCRSLRGNDRHLAGLAAQLAQDVLLDAVVVGHYVEARRLVFYPDYC